MCTQSVTALSEWAFREAGFHRLELEHSIHNPRSCRVATKAGFSEEGVRRSSARHADGWHDMHVHARLRSDQPSAPTRAARASV
nr:GNAT family protein [Rhodococcus sp. ARC_M8]